MYGNGGPKNPATRLQGMERRGGRASQPPSGGPPSVGTVAPDRNRRRQGLFETSLRAKLEQLQWDRKVAASLVAAAVLVFIAGATATLFLAPHGMPADSQEASRPALLIWSPFVGGTFVAVALMGLFNNLRQQMAHTLGELDTVEAKRGASAHADLPGGRVIVMKDLLRVDKNPKIKDGESTVELARTERPLKVIADAVVKIVRAITELLKDRGSGDGPTGRPNVQGKQAGG